MAQQHRPHTEPGQPVGEVSTASSLTKSVWAIQRSGRVPRTTKPPGFAWSSSKELNPLRSTGTGRITGRRAPPWAGRRGRTPPGPTAQRSTRATLPGHRRHLEDRPAALGDLGADEVGEFTRLGDVDLVEHHRTRPVGEVAQCGVALQGGPVATSSASSASISEIGSRPGSRVAQSTTCTRTAQRSM